MRTSGWGPVAGWCVATAGSVALASAAILPVLRTTEPALARPPAAATSFPAALPSSTPAAAERPTRRTAPPPTRTEDGWTVTVVDGLRTYVRAFKVEGGQAVIRMTSAGKAEVVTATPADGWAVQQVQNTPDNLAVYFNETGHSFIIHATWWDDRPFAQVSEIGE